MELRFKMVGNLFETVEMPQKLAVSKYKLLWTCKWQL